ncbi:MAG: acyltransferase family protein [Clostridia bacterium]|nr:acyltransferase family protein [Clostridia bacterium]
MEKKRFAGLDLVRSCAIFFVIVLHSVSLNGALGEDMNSIWWAVNLYVRHLAFCCVPLFIMLTGYLQKNKRFSFSYYKGIIPLGISYLLISMLSLIGKAINDSSLVLTPGYVIAKILDFTANDYAWYFEMYLGLFLLIPFLNAAFEVLKTKRARLALILTLIFLTLMPETLKSFSPAYSPNGGIVIDIIPEFFTSLYPLTYYFIGAYFATYKPFEKVGRITRLLAALLAPAIPFFLCFGYSHARGTYAWYMMNGFNTLTIALTAVCVFALLYDIDVRSKLISLCSRTVSEATFEIYLYSFIFDSFYYAYFRQHHVIMIAMVFASSFVAAFVTRLVITNPLSGIISRLYMRLAVRLDAEDTKNIQTEADNNL